MKKKLAAILIPVILIGLIIAVAVTRKAKSEYSDTGVSISDSGFFFDTVITITLYGDSASSLIEECFDLCREYESLLSRTVEGSDIWNINHADGKPTEVDPRTAGLIADALSYSVLTEGRFDISIAAASTLWDFTDHNNDLPDPDALNEAIKHIDYTKIHVSGSTVILDDPEMMIDLGGIAKGFIADQLKDYLVSKGVKNALINLGGNVLVIGDKPDGFPFLIGIQYPFRDEGETIAAAMLSDSSLVTSGGYERYIENDGRVFHHILDPKTGYGIDSDIVSVSICCSSSMQADALSTCTFLLGYDEGTKLIESQKNVSALIITDDLKLHPVGNFPLKETQ